MNQTRAAQESFAADFRAFVRRAAAAFENANLPAAKETARALRAAETAIPRRAAADNAARNFAAAPNTRKQLSDFCAQLNPARPLFRAAAKIARAAPWRASGNGAVCQNMAAELIGPDGWTKSPKIRIGLFFQPAEFFYPWHRHAAEEIYLILGGAATWRAENKTPQTPPPGAFVFHHARQPHAMQTAESPLFAVWAWRGDIARESYELCEPPENTAPNH